MSNLTPTATIDRCEGVPSAETLEALPFRATTMQGLPIRRLLPVRGRRLVGPWCFLDSFGPLAFESGKPMDVAPHPHIGLQTVSWLLEGEVLHHDSLGETGLARPGVLNLMTAGRGIAHSEQTPRGSRGRLHGVQLWVALPDARRQVAPCFESRSELPRLELEGGVATLLLGELGGLRSPATTFSPIVGADLEVAAGSLLSAPLEPGFEHALLLMRGDAATDGRELAPDVLYFLGSGRPALRLESREGARAILIGGAPLGETVLMWWNFVARTTDEIAAARADWQAGRRFGEVAAYSGSRLPAPELIARPVA
ncbi:MAG: pirin family protein [Vicinamibacteria bacterium]